MLNRLLSEEAAALALWILWGPCGSAWLLYTYTLTPFAY